MRLLSELLIWPNGEAPYEKQEEAHAMSADEKVFALLLQQRCGKTPIALGTFAHQYARFVAAGGFYVGRAKFGAANLPKLPRFFRIEDLPKDARREMLYRPSDWATAGVDAMLVVAMPSGLPRNWAYEAARRLPASMRARALVWDSGKAGQVNFAESFRALLSHVGAALLLVNGEALTSATCRKAIGAFLRTRRALVVADETSLLISQPTNLRAKVMRAIKGLPGAVMRRILDGTPADESPFDLFAQFEFLDKRILGHETFTGFKARYGKYKTTEIYIKNRKTGVPEPHQIPKVVGYDNLDEIARRIARFSFSVKRSDVFDIPGKLYQPWRFELSAAQKGVYEPLRDEFEAELRDGTLVSADHVLARMTRLDQVRANYWPPTILPTICGACAGEGCAACGDLGAVMSKTKKKVIDPNANPLIDALGDVLTVNKEPGIVWCAFDETVDAVLERAASLGRTPVRYDGKVSDEQKAVNLAAFQGGHADVLVAKEASAGRGLDGRAAAWLCYVENGYSNRKRSQSEDRAEVARRSRGTGVIDLIAEGSFDDAKLEAQRTKRSVKEVIEEHLRRGRSA